MCYYSQTSICHILVGKCQLGISVRRSQPVGVVLPDRAGLSRAETEYTNKPYHLLDTESILASQHHTLHAVYGKGCKLETRGSLVD